MFDNLGLLNLHPYCMDYDSNQVKGFLCLRSDPNCIVILLNSGIIHHCVFLPNTRSALADHEAFESTNV